MEANRFAGIVAELSTGNDGGRSSRRLCELTTDVIGVSGTGVMLMSREVPYGSLCTTNAVSAVIEELQFTLGEGPCIDAYHHNVVVLEPDLADPGLPRWLAFTPKALEAGVRAVFGFPLRLGAVRLGALNLYQDRPGPLSNNQHANALVMADLVAQWVLNVQADAPAGALAEELERDGDFHSVVHNAAGIVSVQLGVSVTEAMIRLRAYSFGNERQLREVAQDLVARKLRFG